MNSTYRRQRKALRSQISSLKRRTVERDSHSNSHNSLQLSSLRSSSNALLAHSLLSNNRKSILRVNISQLEAEEGAVDSQLRSAQ